jgi:hypothetical protein
MFPPADLVCHAPEPIRRRMAIQLQRFVGRESAALRDSMLEDA